MICLKFIVIGTGKELLHQAVFSSDKMMIVKRIIALFVLLYALLFLLPFCLPSCADNKQFQRNKSHPDVPLSSIRKGAALAAQYCRSCHVLPDPALLDAATWEKGVLPHMGSLLGIFYYNHQESIRPPSTTGI